MANQVFSVTLPDIHQGPPLIWYNTLAPADGSRMLIDANGNPQNPAATTWVAATAYSLGQEVWDGTNIEICIVAGTSQTPGPPIWPAVGSTLVDGTATWLNLGVPVSLGASEGPCTIHIESTIEEVKIDQETAFVDGLLVAEAARFETTLKETSMKKISFGIPNALYSSGTDAGLPAGAQAYEQIDSGGLIVPGGSGFAGAFPAFSVISPRRGNFATNKYMVFTLYAGLPKDIYQSGISRMKEAMWKIRIDGLAQLWRTKRKRVAQFYRQT